MTWRAALPLQFSTRVAAFAVDEAAVTSMLSWQVPSSADAAKSLLEHQQERTVVLAPEVGAAWARGRALPGCWAGAGAAQQASGPLPTRGRAHRGSQPRGVPTARPPRRPSDARARRRSGRPRLHRRPAPSRACTPPTRRLRLASCALASRRRCGRAGWCLRPACWAAAASTPTSCCPPWSCRAWRSSLTRWAGGRHGAHKAADARKLHACSCPLGWLVDWRGSLTRWVGAHALLGWWAAWGAA